VFYNYLIFENMKYFILVLLFKYLNNSIRFFLVFPSWVFQWYEGILFRVVGVVGVWDRGWGVYVFCVGCRPIDWGNKMLLHLFKINTWYSLDNFIWISHNYHLITYSDFCSSLHTSLQYSHYLAASFYCTSSSSLHCY